MSNQAITTDHVADQAKVLDNLTQLAQRAGADVRPTLLRVMTDLYVQKPEHSPEAEQQFAETALRLFDVVDAETRKEIAERIAGYPSAPAAVRQRALRECITVSQPAAADKRANTLSSHAAAADELSELFFAASAEERRLILLNLPYALLPPAAPIDPLTARDAVQRLETAALGHKSDAFARELERVLSISRMQARRLIEDETGEPIAVIAIALDMPSAVLQRVLLCLNPSVAQSVQRVYDLTALHEEIEPEAALRLLAIWQASHRATEPLVPERPALPQPHHWDIEPGGRSAPTVRPKIRWEEHALARSAESA